MFRRGMLFFVAMCAAVGVPYAANEWGKPRQVAGQPNGAAANGGPANPAGFPGAAYPTTAAYANAAASLDGVAPLPSIAGLPATDAEINAPPVVEMSDALRFDVTASWILGRWPRVTAGLPDAGLQGFRVAFMSGTQQDDVAGSLTYYFNREHLCQRITFQGTTGDARKLITLLASRYGFVKQTSDDPGMWLYQIRWNGRATSELQIRPARIIRADAPNARFEVLLAMNDASGH
ncbi:MAG TPA: DUF6690 family protein [Pirellulales bacterium]|jgi:hypothetical protein|nr:DUF6690 family protein [Pirellulales bacterium]